MSTEAILLEKNIIQDNGQKILQISFKNLEIVEFQLNMINNHENRGLSQVEKYVFNNNTYLKYSTYGYKSLGEYIQATEVDLDTFKTIFNQIGQVVQECKDLLLESDNFVLEKDCIFINESDLSIKLINLPLVETYNDNVNDKYLELASSVITELMMSAKVKTGSAEFMINTNKFILDNSPSIKEFLQFINKIEYQNTEPVAKVESIVNPITVKKMEPIKTSESTKKIEPVKVKPIEKTKQPIKQQKPQIKPKTVANSTQNQSQKTKIDKSEDKGPKTVERMRYKTSRVIGAIIVQPVIIGIILGMFLLPGVGIMQIGIGALGMLLLDGIILKNLLDPSKKEKVKVLVKNSNNKPSNKKQSNKLKKEQPKKENIKANKNKKQATKNDETVYLDDATEFLDDATALLSETAYLQNENGETVALSDSFVIGRHAQLQEWITSKNIGRTHAQITKYENGYFIEDLQSKNGTSVNGVKLNAHESVALDDGDVISLPELTITFKLY